MTEKTPILRVRGLTKNYPIQRTDASLYARAIGRMFGWTGRLDDWRALNNGLPILKGVDLDVYKDETLVIVGPSGAGKSTLLHLMGAIDVPSSGSIIHNGKDLVTLGEAGLATYRNRSVGFVFQFYHLFPDLSAHENVYVPALVSCSALGWTAVEHRRYKDRARELLRRVGLERRLRHRPAQLSGGEQQRVAIARALLLEPELVLCDEPTGNLDRKTGDEVLELLWELKAKSGQTYVIVTHDRRLAERAHRVVEMEDGKLKSETEGLGMADALRPPHEPGRVTIPAEPTPAEAEADRFVGPGIFVGGVAIAAGGIAFALATAMITGYAVIPTGWICFGFGLSAMVVFGAISNLILRRD